MADNTLLNTGAGGDTVRNLARLAGTVKTSVAQIDLGGGAANAEVLLTAGQQLMAVSMPVVIASNQTALPVTGTFFPGTQPVSGPLTDAQLRAAVVPVSLVSTTVTGTVAVSGPLTDTQLRATPVPVSGTVSTGDLTDAQLRASAVPVSLASTTITGNVAVTGPLTDTQLRATPVPISGTVSTGGLTDTQLRATAVPVSGPLTDTQLRATSLNVTTTSQSLVSTSNSTTTALGIGGVFTGVSEAVNEFSSISVTVFANQVSATDGLRMQQSSDGTNWDMEDAYTVPASTGKTYSIAAAAKFFRITYTNGGVAQTVFRLQAMYNKADRRGSSVRPQDARPNDNDFEEVLGFNMVFNGTSWDRVRGDATNGLRTQMTPVTSLTTLSAANTAVTLTLPAPAAGLFHYITRIRITNHNTSAAAVAGSAVTLSYTTTNLPGSLAWTEGNALAAGVSKTVVDEVLENPIKASVAATATTIVAPAAGLGVLVRATAYYYTGP